MITRKVIVADLDMEILAAQASRHMAHALLATDNVEMTLRILTLMWQDIFDNGREWPTYDGDGHYQNTTTFQTARKSAHDCMSRMSKR